MSGSVKLAIANEGEINLPLDVVSKWEPKKVQHIGTSVFFKADGTSFSMSREDFNRIFKK